MNKYYTLKEVADDCGCEVDRLLLYGITGELEICLVAYEPRILKEIGLEVKPELIKEIGPHLIPRDNILKIRNADFFSTADRPSKGEICERLIVTHEEKIRFEKEHKPEKKMGTRERENLLRIIGALIKIHYQETAYRKKDGSPNADAIAKEFHNWLLLNDYSDKGIADGNFRKHVIPDAYKLIMEAKEEP